MRYFVLISIFLVASIYCEGPLSNFEASLTFNWEGESVHCHQTCEEDFIYYNSSYACSDGRGTWNNGSKLFADPLPPASSSFSYLVTQATVSVLGLFDCSNKTTNLKFYLQNTLIKSVSLPNNGSNCDCLNCVTNITLTSDEFWGWPDYNYNGHKGGTNTFYIETDSVICVAKATLVLSYIQQIPQIVQLVPAAGPTTGNTTVSVVGDTYSFYPHLDYFCVFGGDPPIPAMFVNTSTLSCETNLKNEPFLMNFAIRVNGILSQTNLKYRYYVPPVLLSLVPNSASAGEYVVITGLHFLSLPSQRVMWGDNFSAGLLLLNASSYGVVVPSGAGTVNVSLTLNGQQFTNNLQFSYANVSTTGASSSSFTWHTSWEMVLGMIALTLAGPLITVFIVLLLKNIRRKYHPKSYVQIMAE